LPKGAEPTRRDVVGRFERDSAHIGRARRLVSTSLQDWGLERHIAPLELAVSELVTNAVVHGEGEIEVRLVAEDDELRLEVADGGGCSTPPRPVRSGSEVPGGWGLRLVEEISHRWGASTGPSQTRVWMVRRTQEPR
jgi:anti-sigma regulatory factor (Ser/Thr protein kinase)